MRKLVLGIIALVSVQFAFVTYMMVLQSPVELTDATSTTRPIPRTARITPIDHANDLVDTATQPEIAPSSSIPRHVATDRRSKVLAAKPLPIVSEKPFQTERVASTLRVSKPAFNQPRSKSAAPVEFQNVVIRYNRDQALSDCDRQEATKTKKRSYIAKAVPVIKKPWDWLKAIGSKFN